MKDLKNEVWLEHPSIAGLECSNFGRVREVRKTLKRFRRILKVEKITAKNYSKISFKGKSYMIHRIVSEVFIPNPDNKPFINHKDGNRQNNSVINLEWCTAQENNLHAFHVNGRDTQHKKRSVEIIKDGNVLHTAPSVRLAARYIKGDSSNISSCCKGLRKQHLGYYFRYSTQPVAQPKNNSCVGLLKTLTC